MAARKVVVKLQHNEAVVKCINDVDAQASLTIGLSTDLLKSNEDLSGAPIRVSVSSIDSAIPGTKEINLVRNSVMIMNLFENTNTLPMLYGADSEQAESDIVVNFTGKGTVYIRLLKTSGYTPKFKPEQGVSQ